MKLILFLSSILLHADVTFNSVPLPSDDELPPEIQQTLAEKPPLNVYRMLANIPKSFQPYMDLAASIFDGNLDSITRETVFLRVARDVNSSYEWHQQVFLGKTAGLTDKQIAAIKKENPVKSLGDEGNFICKVVDELTRNSNLSDDTFHELFNRYSIEKGCELIFDISIANALGRFINGTRVQIEKTNPLEGLASPQ